MESGENKESGLAALCCVLADTEREQANKLDGDLIPRLIRHLNTRLCSGD
jgi:hypothetical protein